MILIIKSEYSEQVKRILTMFYIDFKILKTITENKNLTRFSFKCTATEQKAVYQYLKMWSIPYLIDFNV